MIGRTVRDTLRLYRGNWWRLSLVVTLTGITTILVVWAVARLTSLVARGLRGTLETNGHLSKAGVLGLTIGMGVALMVLCIPLVSAGMSAAVRITDDALAGRRPRILRSFAAGLGRSPHILLAAIASVVVFVSLVVLSPVISALGIVGLVLTPLAKLLARRWGALARHRPTVRALVWMAVPLALALRWLTRAALLFPSGTLEVRKALPALRNGARVARGRGLAILVMLIGAVLSVVALSALVSWLGYVIGSTKGEVLGQAASQLLFLSLPVVVVTILFRLSQSAPPGSPLPSSLTVAYAVGAEPEPPPFLSGDNPSMMTRWRLRHRRTAFFMPLVIIAGLLVTLGGPASAEGGPVTTPGGTATLTVNSSADDTALGTLATEEANCLAASGTCTLRAAALEAQALAGGGVDGTINIGFSGDTTVDVSAADPISFFYSPPEGGPGFAGTLTIDGLGHAVVIDGQSASEDLNLNSTTWTFDLSGLEIRNGSATDAGGGVAIGGAGTSTIDRVTFDNDVAGDAGGAIYTSGRLLVQNSTFFDNTAGHANADYIPGGADIYNSFVLTTANNDTFAGSTGGAVFNLASAGYSMSINNNFFAVDVPGAFDCTDSGGSGMSGTDNVVAFQDTTCPGVILAPAGSPTVGPFGVVAPGTPPVLPLAQPSIFGNPVNAAMGAGGNDGVTCPTPDERGQPRPTTGCDAGSYQYQPATTVTVSSSENPSLFGDSVTFTAHLSMANESLTPTGSVQFSIDGSPVGTPQIVSQYGDAGYTTSTLSTGAHDVTAAFSSGIPTSYSDSSTASALVQHVDATPGEVTVKSSANPALSGSSVTLTVTVTNSNSSVVPTGTVSLSDTTNKPATVLGSGLTLDSSGSATVTTSTLPTGERTLVATYSGDSNYGPGTSPVFTQDIQVTSTLTLTPSSTEVAFGAPVTFDATVSNTAAVVPTGTIRFSYTTSAGQTIDDVAVDSSGKASITPSGLPVGSADEVDAQYFGDGTYAKSALESVDVKIDPASTTTAMTGIPTGTLAYGVPVTLTAVVTNTATDSTADPIGTVSFSTTGGLLDTASLTGNGDHTATATYVTTAGQLPTGTDPLSAVYNPSADFVTSTAPASSVTVGQASTSTALVSDANPAAFGQLVNLTATVSATGGSTAVPTGSVTFTEGTTTLGTVTLAAGSATLGTATLTVGTHHIVASYATTGPFNGSGSTTLDQVVNNSATTTTLTVTPAGGTPFGTTVNLGVTVAPVAPGGGTPGGSVTVTEGATTVAVIPLTNGQGSAQVSTLGTATHDFLATYAATTGYDGSSDSATYSVSAASTSTGLGFSPSSSYFGNTVTLTATVTDTSAGSSVPPVGTVTFSEQGTVLGTVSLLTSSATSSTATLMTSALPESAFTPHGLPVTATFNGSTNFNGSSDTVDYSIAQATTSVSLQTSTLVVGTPATITATITVTNGGGEPTGSVLFTDTETNGTSFQLGTATVTNGQASLSNVLLPVESKTLKATYTNTDFNYVAGAPATLPVTVGLGTPGMTAGVSDSGLVYGQSDSVSASITVGSGPAPTGTVTFTATGPGIDVTLGTASVGGSGPYSAGLNPTTVSIPVGATLITAAYGGDGNYNAVTASVAAPVITAAPTTTNLSSTANPSFLGQPVTFTATVADPTTGAVPIGTVAFSLGGVALGTVALDGTGHASITVTPATAGSPAVGAVFTPSSNFSGSNGSATQTINLLAVIVTLQANIDAPVEGELVTFTATVSPTALAGPWATSAPTGTVFVSGGTTAGCTITLGPDLGSVHSSFGTCQASWPTSGQPVVVGAYSGDSMFAAGTSPGLGLIVSPNIPVVTLTSTPASWVTGEPLTLAWSVVGPTVDDGTITLKLNGATMCTSSALIGSCSYTFPSTYLGSAGFILSYSGDSAWQAGFASLTQAVTGCETFATPTVSPAGAGTITVLTAPNCDNGGGYLSGTRVVLEETANPDYQLNFWADTGSTLAIESIVVGTTGFSDEAFFNPICVTLTLGTGDIYSAGGSINSSVSPNCGPVPRNWQYMPDGTVVGSFAKGTSLTLTPVAPYPLANGATQVFYQWYGNIPTGSQVTDSPLPLVMTGDLELSASFGVTCYHNISFPTPAGGTAVISGTNCGDPTGSGYAQYSNIAVSTKATGSAYFIRWTGGVVEDSVSPSGSTAHFGATRNGQTITASYGTCVSFSVVEYGNGPAGGALGSVSLSPTGNCPTLGTGWYEPGTRVAINAQPFSNTAGTFFGWTGPPTELGSQFASNYLTVNTSGSEIAFFFYGPGCQPFATQSIPAGSSTITTSFTFGNNCPPGQYDDTVTQTGSPTILQATATSGHPLLGWTGQTTVETAEGVYKQQLFRDIGTSGFSFTFLGPTDMTAWACEAIQPLVTLISPDGTSHTGPSPSDADFIDASPAPDCPLGNLDYTVGTIVSPAANAPTAGYTFVSWSGAETGSAKDPGGFLLDGSTGSRSLTATYQVICHALNSNFAEGVAASPAPNCPDTPASANEYVGGTFVTLQQTGHSGDNFNGWTGSPDGTSGSFAWTSMTSDTSIYANYQSKSTGQVISDAFTSLGTDLAITAKKAVGVVASVAGGLLMGLNPVTAIAGIIVLAGTGVSDLLGALGVQGGTLDSLNLGLSDVAQTLTMLDAALTCATVWSANANTDVNNNGADPLAQTGALASAAYFAHDASTAYDETLASQEAAQQAAFETQYSLTGAPVAAVADVSSVSKGIGYVQKYGTRLGVVGAVAAGIYSEVSSGPNVGWDSSASAAWTGGGDVYNACVDSAEPTYFQ